MITATELKRKDTILVETPTGEEVELFNWATVEKTSRARPGETETFEPRVFAGDAIGMEPDAVTCWLAEWLWDNHSVDVENLGIDVIDPTEDGVTVL